VISTVLTNAASTSGASLFMLFLLISGAGTSPEPTP
jgi:hypothetical protein